MRLFQGFVPHLEVVEFPLLVSACFSHCGKVLIPLSQGQLELKVERVLFNEGFRCAPNSFCYARTLCSLSAHDRHPLNGMYICPISTQHLGSLLPGVYARICALIRVVELPLALVIKRLVSVLCC
jgi:hypothetical protein